MALTLAYLAFNSLATYEVGEYSWGNKATVWNISPLRYFITFCSFFSLQGAECCKFSAVSSRIKIHNTFGNEESSM